MDKKWIHTALLFPDMHTKSIVHVYFLCTFHFKAEATKNGTPVLSLTERARVVGYHWDRSP